MNATRQPPSSPCCGEALDAATAAYEEATPSDGDLSICFYCFAWLTFDGGTLRRMTGDEIIELDNQTHLQMQRATNAVRDVRPQMVRSE